MINDPRCKLAAFHNISEREMFCVFWDERWLPADFAGIKIGVALQMFLLAPPTLTFSHQPEPSLTARHMAALKHTSLHPGA